MGKLTIDEMHNSLYDYAQAVSDESLLTENKTIVGAINEIYGKQLIADAIGEPLIATDTFNEMSNDINTLLSSFKTNMMNAGVVVNSGDRFKSLIDKIATMVEEGGKGIQYAEGSSDVTVGMSESITIVEDIGFIPTIAFAVISLLEHGDNYNFRNFNNAVISSCATTKYSANDSTIQLIISNESLQIKTTSSNVNTATGFQIYSNQHVQWYAIGVGEGDTNNKGLDIISATELPENGKEGQICVITNNPVDNILVTSSVTDVQSDGISIYLGNSSSGDVSMGTVLPISSNGITMNYYFNRIYQGSERLESYYYSNNTWNQLTQKYTPIFEDGVATNTALNPSLSYNGASITNGELVINASAQGDFYLVYTKNKINFNDISKIEVVLKKNWVNGNYNVRIYVASTDNPSTFNNMVVNQSYRDINSTDYITWTIDTSSWTGSHYLMIQKYNEYSGLYCYIKSIRLY